MIANYLARQFSKPEGWFGRWLIAPYLNRVNMPGNQLVFDTTLANSEDTILEIGFGGANLLFRISSEICPEMLVGVELSVDMIEKVKHRCRDSQGQIHLAAAGVGNLPFDKESFSLVYSVNTIYFWPDLQQGLLEMARVLKPDGRVLLGFGCAESLRRAGYEQRGFSLYDIEQIQDYMERSGFTAFEVFNVGRAKRGPFYVLRAYRKND